MSLDGQRRIRVRTVVLGLALLVVAVLSAVSAATDVRVDGVAVALALLIGAGLALLAGGVTAAVRESRARDLGGPTGGPG